MADDSSVVDEWLAEAAVMRAHLASLQREIGPEDMCAIVRESGSVAEAEVRRLADALRSAGYVSAALLI